MASDPEAEKLAVATAAAAGVPDGIRLGLGSGTTIELFALALAARVKQGLRVSCVPTSRRIAELAKAQGLTLIDLETDPLDLAVDGADEVDPRGGLIKGAGGALVRERIVAAAAKRFQVLIDSRKLVARLGERMPLPIEIQPFGAALTARRVAELLGSAVLRFAAGVPYVSDNGGYLLDCKLRGDVAPETLAPALRAIPGVVDTGFFLGFSPEVLVGRATGVERLLTA